MHDHITGSKIVDLAESIAQRLERVLVSIYFLTFAAVSFLGIWAAHTSPVLFNEYGQLISQAEIKRIESVGHVRLEPNFFVGVPEFTRDNEHRWFSQHASIFEILNQQSTVTARTPKATEFVVSHVDLPEIFNQLGMLYIAATVLFLNAVYVFFKVRTDASKLLSVSIASASLYYVSAGAVAARSITFDPVLLKFLVVTSYVASSGLITLVHFAFVFPRRQLKGRLGQALVISMYGYTAVVIVLYFTNVIGYGDAVPFVLMWTLILMLGFVRSIYREYDTAIRDHLWLIFPMPIIATGIFTFWNVLPNAFVVTPLPITQQALFAMMTGLGLTFSVIGVEKYGRNLNELRAKIAQMMADEETNKPLVIADVAEILTPREYEIVEGFIHGHDAKALSNSLHITQQTVHDHCRNIYRKLGVNRVLQLVSVATGVTAREHQMNS